MYEFDSVSVSTYEASSLAAKLTEKSGEGWDVVAVVPTGSDITAFLKRDSSSSTSTEPATDTGVDAAATTAAAVAEPAGWGSAPESSTSTASTGTWGSTTGAAAGAAASTPADTTGGWGSTAAAPAAAAPATPTVPAGWYADPANRYELRYWDGSAWTEHVSRAGQQYTDPPVA